jgi:molybdopterin converting factor small subunit
MPVAGACQLSSDSGSSSPVRITVRLLASYRQYLPDDHDEDAGYPFRVADGALVGDVLAALPIPPGDFYTFLVNGRHATHDQALHEGDLLSLFPAAGGG